MSDTKPSLRFPHPTLTPIDGEPTYATIKLLQKEVTTNAKAVTTLRGGGRKGHLAVCLSPEAYSALEGTEPWTDPDPPGALPDTTNATQAQITRIDRVYNANVQEWNTFNAVHEALKAQILTAVEAEWFDELDDEVDGFSEVPVRRLLEYLKETYGEITSDDIVNNREAMAQPWDLDAPIRLLWSRLDKQLLFARNAKAPITDREAIQATIRALEQTGGYEHAIQTWKDKGPNHSMKEFRKHLNYQDKLRRQSMTSKTAGYHSANHADGRATADAATLDTASTMSTLTAKLAAALIAQAKTAPPNAAARNARLKRYCVEADTIKLFYCWTHGLGRNPKHTSATCRAKATGHRDDATILERLGGSNVISFPPK